MVDARVEKSSGLREINIPRIPVNPVTMTLTLMMHPDNISCFCPSWFRFQINLLNPLRRICAV